MGGTAMAALVVGGLFLLPRGGAGTLTPQDTGDVLPSVETSTTADGAPSIVDGTGPATTDDTAAAPTSEPSIGGDTLPGDTVTGGPSTTAGAATTDVTAAPTTAGGGSTAPDTTASPPATSTPATTGTTTAGSAVTTTSAAATTTTDDTSTSSSVSSTTDAPGPAPFTETYESPGGSITVDWDGTRLSLLSVAPAPGFSSEIKDDNPDRVRVEFDDGATDWRIDVRFTGDDVTVEVT